MTVTYQSDKQVQLEADWSKISHSKQIAGHISLNYTTTASTTTPTPVTHNYQIPFAGQLVKGEINYDDALTQFLVKPTEPEAVITDSRTFRLKNNFSLPLLVTNVTVPENFTQNFRTFGFLQPILIPPSEEKDLFNLGVTNASTVSSKVYLHTNVSVYEIPVHCFTGHLRRVVPLEVSQFDPDTAIDEGEINFGILPVSVYHHALIAFVNPNPVPIKVTNFKARTQSGSVSVVLRGCGPLTTDGLELCNRVQPNEWIVFEINVMAPNVGSYSSKFYVSTEIGGQTMEEIVTPIRFTTAMGRLELNKDLLHFTDCYPVSFNLKMSNFC